MGSTETCKQEIFIVTINLFTYFILLNSLKRVIKFLFEVSEMILSLRNPVYHIFNMFTHFKVPVLCDF